MGLLKSSVARKVAMALSGLFLVFFLGQHFVINVSSVIDPETFNSWSHFMGTNGVVQFLLQPVLIFGVIFHFVMGFILELQNRRARAVRYTSYKGHLSASWAPPRRAPRSATTRSRTSRWTALDGFPTRSTPRRRNRRALPAFSVGLAA